MSDTNTNTVTSETAPDKEQNKSQPRTSAQAKRGRGRPATVSDKAFIEVHAKSASLDDVINAFSMLRAMEPKKARLYVSMRAAALRRKGNSLKTFPRGRKTTPEVEVTTTPTTPVME